MATIRFMLESERDYDSVTDMSFRLTGIWVQNEDDWSDLDMYPIPGEESSIMALEDLRIKARITDNELEVPPDFFDYWVDHASPYRGYRGPYYRTDKFETIEECGDEIQAILEKIYDPKTRIFNPSFQEAISPLTL